MDHIQFDALTRLLGRALPRRAAPPLLGVVVAALLTTADPAMGKKKKKKKKKTTLCLDGQTIQASKKKKKKFLKSGATAGACPPVCTPTCPGTACGGDDGCGGICGCPAGSICHSGICQTCHVSCPGDGAACGNDLQNALSGGGTIRACPGRYIGTFEVLAPNTFLIGAGDGEDPANSTILDATGSGRVLEIASGVVAALQGVRITGGDVAGAGLPGGGIFTRGRLSLTSCTVSKNKAQAGGGIAQSSEATGPLELTDCRVTGNTTTSLGGGGGISNGSDAQPTTLSNCTVSGNESGTFGGGIFTLFGTLSIVASAITGNKAFHHGGGVFIDDAATVTFDSASSVTGNKAGLGGLGGQGGGIYSSGLVNLNSATVSTNDPNNCAGTVAVAGCSG